MKSIAKQFNDNTIFKRVDKDYVYLINIADAHIGSMIHNKERLEETINLVKSRDDVFVIIGGDVTEHATTTGASSIFEESYHGIEQVYKARDLLLPIKDKILYIRSGNHGQGRALKYSKIPPEQVLASLLEVPYVTGISTVIINARKNCYVISSVHHNRRPNALEWLGSDIVYIEHTHQQNYERKLSMFMNRYTKKWVARPVYYVYAGSFLSYGGYGAERAYRITDTGCPVVELCGIQERWGIYVYDNIENFQRLVKTA